MLLAGDVGGTKTLLGLFERAEPRPLPVAVHTYASAAFPTFTHMLDAFAADVGRPFTVEAAAAGVAGPVLGDTARLTNLPWHVHAAEMAVRFAAPRARLLNDLEAMATSADVLVADEVLVLQDGAPRHDGNAVVIAAGTGLGQAFLHRVDGHLRPLASEGGHADFAPRTDREIALLQMLRTLYGRAEVEHVLSGPGLINLHRFTHEGRACPAIEGVEVAAAPAVISQAALGATCRDCMTALDMFVEIYGAEAGNLALRGMATSGVFIGGGIAPKILPALQNGLFMAAFRAKAPMAELVTRMPVKVILNPTAALLGAAVAAQRL